MDHQYIEELRQLDDKKEAKTKLIEYAEQFGIQLKKSKGFDNLVIDIEAALKELASEPVEQVDGGLSISDIIDADDEVSGVHAHVDGGVEAKPEAVLLFDAPMTHAIDHIQVQIPEKELRVEAPIGEVVVPQPVLSENTLEEAVEEIIKDESIFELPENFSPTLMLMGRNPGYATLPWWIYQWISETPDWKSKPTSFSHASAHQTLLSLIYYIKRNGSVLIRETRNSSFVTLK